MIPSRFFARIVGGLVLIALFSGFLILRQCESTKTAKREATLNATQGSAAIQSGGDADDTVGNRMTLDAHFDEITGENDDAIRNATGADAPVDPAVRDAGLVGLCKRAAYSRDPKCLRYTPAR